MDAPVAHYERNLLLRVLPSLELERVLRVARLVDLPVRKMLYHEDSPVTTVFFPLGGLVSLVTPLQDGGSVESAAVGREGFVGIEAFLSTEPRTGNAYAICQIEGSALAVATEDFRHVLPHAPKLRDVLGRFVQASLAHTAQSVACNRAHEIAERCARWLLDADDRIDGSEFRLTQEYLAQMLGVHRPSVTIAAGALQQAGLIAYRRGVVRILDRAGLEEAACECYRTLATRFSRLLPGEHPRVSMANGNGNGSRDLATGAKPVLHALRDIQTGVHHR